MRRAFFILSAFLLALPCSTALSQIAPSDGLPQQASYFYYVYNGKTLQVVNGDPAGANYSEWQIWLYSRNMPVSVSGSGLADVRWGAIDAQSAAAAMQQLTADQQFERAYTNFFGANTWGRFTFSYPIGPVALAGQPPKDMPVSLCSNIDMLNRGLQPVVAELRSSLANAEPSEAPPSVQQYFEDVRNSMQDVARFYDKLSRPPLKPSYLSLELARLTPGVEQAQGVIPKVTAILPTVKLPASKTWMAHSEYDGRDGTVHVTVTEIGSSVWVQQFWTGGDGSMTGTKIITIVPYQDIGTMDIRTQDFGKDRRWTLRIEPAHADAFPQSFTSPVRATAKRTYPAVDLKTNGQPVYLDFSDSHDAQDAYAFFLYHKERGI